MSFQEFDKQMGRAAEQTLKAGAGAMLDAFVGGLRQQFGIPGCGGSRPNIDPLAAAAEGMGQVCDGVQRVSGGVRGRFTLDGSTCTLLALPTDKFLVIQAEKIRVRPHQIDAGGLANLLYRNSCGWAVWGLLQEAVGVSLLCHARLNLAAVAPDLVGEGAAGVGIETIGLLRRLQTG